MRATRQESWTSSSHGTHSGLKPPDPLPLFEGYTWTQYPPPMKSCIRPYILYSTITGLSNPAIDGILMKSLCNCSLVRVGCWYCEPSRTFVEIRGYLLAQRLKRVDSYLEHRTQMVSFDYEWADEDKIKRRIPQGSVLESFLILFYNDFPTYELYQIYTQLIPPCLMCVIIVILLKIWVKIVN